MAIVVLHPRHRTFVEAFPNITWDALHFEHLTFMNFPFRSMYLDDDFGLKGFWVGG